VLFDTGSTLTRPIGGRWNPRFDFESVVLRHHPDAPADSFEAAFAVGQAFLDAAPSTAGRDDYHRVILAELGVPAERELLDELDRTLEQPPIEPYPDVRRVLDGLLSGGIRMAIVTDNWGTADTVKRNHDLIGPDGLFEVCVVSEELGCNKPDPRMYRAASEALGLQPGDCFYLDDDASLVEAAIALGYRGAAICRDGSATTAPVASITSLDELLPLL
jgi:HAD superfamily hydrolase (TIGR01509 family)